MSKIYHLTRSQFIWILMKNDQLLYRQLLTFCLFLEADTICKLLLTHFIIHITICLATRSYIHIEIYWNMYTFTNVYVCMHPLHINLHICLVLETKNLGISLSSSVSQTGPSRASIFQSIWMMASSFTKILWAINKKIYLKAL